MLANQQGLSFISSVQILDAVYRTYWEQWLIGAVGENQVCLYYQHNMDDATCQICHYGLEYSLRIHGFRCTWPCLIVKIHTNHIKFLESSDYYPVISVSSPFAQQILLVASMVLWPSQTQSISFWIRLQCIFICVAFKSHTFSKWYSGYNTRLHLMVRLQFWSSGECRIPFNWHHSQVYSHLEW